MHSDKVTIAIFTKDRPKYLRRQLEIFKDLAFNFQIFILDGSFSGANTRLNLAMARDVGAEYFLEPSLFNRHIILAKELKTEYVAYCADDDLIDPGYYLTACDFLNKNPQYSVAVGKTRGFAYKKHKYLKLRGFTINHLVNNYDIHLGDFVEKINRRDQAYHMGCPPTYYGLRRASLHKIFASYVPKMSSFSGLERLESILNLTEGGITVLDREMGFRDYSATAHSDLERDDPIQYIGSQDIKVLQQVISDRLNLQGMNSEFVSYSQQYAWQLPLRSNMGRYIETRSDLEILLNEVKNQFFPENSFMKSIIKNNKEIINEFNVFK